MTQVEKQRAASEERMSQAYKMRALADNDLMTVMPHVMNLLLQRREMCKYAELVKIGSDQMEQALTQKIVYDNQIKELLCI
jgi:hypothetical protein